MPPPPPHFSSPMQDIGDPCTKISYSIHVPPPLNTIKSGYNKRMHLLLLVVRKLHLLDDVRLIGNEIVALPTISTFEHSSTRPASYKLNSVILVIAAGNMIRSCHWQKTVKIGCLVQRDSLRS